MCVGLIQFRFSDSSSVWRLTYKPIDISFLFFSRWYVNINDNTNVLFFCSLCLRTFRQEQANSNARSDHADYFNTRNRISWAWTQHTMTMMNIRHIDNNGLFGYMLFGNIWIYGIESNTCSLKWKWKLNTRIPHWKYTGYSFALRHKIFLELNVYVNHIKSTTSIHMLMCIVLSMSSF